MLDTESRHGTELVQGPTRDPWLTMDYYLGTDSLSLQEMLDVDIKCEIEGVIGGHTELGFNFTDMSALEMDDDPIGCQNDLSGWFGSTSLLNGNSNSSNRCLILYYTSQNIIQRNMFLSEKKKRKTIFLKADMTS